jgi:hypothetical protein
MGDMAMAKGQRGTVPVWSTAEEYRLYRRLAYCGSIISRTVSNPIQSNPIQSTMQYVLLVATSS